MQHLVDVTLLINLDRDTRKLADMTAELARAGVPFERLPAVDGSKIDRNATLCGAVCTNGMLGCFQSHRKAWQLVADRRLARGLILEDDVRLHDGAVTQTRDAMQQLPPDWDILFLGCHSCGMPGPMDTVLAFAIGANHRERRVSPTVIRPGLASGTYAYIVSSRGARKLLAMLPEPSNHVDLAISSLGSNVQTFAIDPPVVTHLFDNSSIASSTPVLLNALTAFDPPGDRRPLNWSLSEPLCRLGQDSVRLNGWALLFLFSGVTNGVLRSNGTPVLLYLAADYLALSKSWSSALSYLTLAAAFELGDVAARFAFTTAS